MWIFVEEGLVIVLPSAEETVLVAYRENGDIRNTCKIVCKMV